jgi:hypothetical protein
MHANTQRFSLASLESLELEELQEMGLSEAAARRFTTRKAEEKEDKPAVQQSLVTEADGDHHEDEEHHDGEQKAFSGTSTGLGFHFRHQTELCIEDPFDPRYLFGSVVMKVRIRLFVFSIIITPFDYVCV